MKKTAHFNIRNVAKTTSNLLVSGHFELAKRAHLIKIAAK